MLERRALRDDVYTAILELLTAGELGPGDPLPIDGLARRFGVSQTPVREALVQLERTDLVTRTALRGYRVAPPISPQQIRELVDVRSVLEAAAVERAYRRRDEVAVMLASALDDHRAAAKQLLADPNHDRSSYLEYFEKDWRFHQVFLDNCDNHYMCDITNQLSFSIHRMRQAMSAGTTDADAAVHEHEVILQTFSTGTVEQAKQAMLDHLNNVIKRSLSDSQLPRTQS